MLSVFTLPFDVRETPVDWLIVCLILLNIVALIALFTAYIEFKVKPPLPKFNVHGVFKFLRVSTTIRANIFGTALVLDVVILFAYIAMVSARIIHLILFE